MENKLILDLSNKVRNYIINTFKTSRCMCGISSCLLFEEFKKNNIKCKIVSNNHHAFVIVNTDLLVDVTSDQFSVITDQFSGYTDTSAIVIKKYDDIKCKHYFWKIDLEFYSSKDFINHQYQTRWPKDQIISEDLFENFSSFYNEKAA